jgi:hypothetical protein
LGVEPGDIILFLCQSDISGFTALDVLSVAAISVRFLCSRLPNPNVPEDFQKDDKQAGNSETCTTLTNVGIPAVIKNISLKTADTPNIYGIGCVISRDNIGKISLFTTVTIYSIRGVSCFQ